ncbi:ATP-binding cassette domain-containing protein [Desulfosporosinus sp. BG]|uniref:ATP-binding cassette domain-containing protein n=1 Tax=Desulfosporosinus sp. BG TaxID=1633135 RepID=UPI00083A25AF|nr:ATP-binding cassette domain-containing protein [Desulfosporosinus sp. BG]
MIELNKLKKTYGDTVALDPVSVAINDGICFGLIGPNGTGKSTLIKIIAGVTQKYDGEISFNGKPIEKNRFEIKKMIGYVPQDLVLEKTIFKTRSLMIEKTSSSFFQAIGSLFFKNSPNKWSLFVSALRQWHWPKTSRKFTGDD